jgi:hypothetical protein
VLMIDECLFLQLISHVGVRRCAAALGRNSG